MKPSAEPPAVPSRKRISKLKKQLSSLNLQEAKPLEVVRKASSTIDSLEAQCDELTELNSELTSELRGARRRHNDLQGAHSRLQSELAQARQRAEVLDAQNTLYLRSMRQIEDQHATLLETNSRLAFVTAQASESIAELEDRDSALMSTNQSLASANATSAELVCELEEQADRLREALERVRVLQGLISICMHCHKIRDDGAVWNRLEEYMVKHSDVRLSHGLCPTCLEEHYP